MVCSASFDAIPQITTLVLDGNHASVDNIVPSISGRLLTKLQLVMVCSASFDAIPQITTLVLDGNHASVDNIVPSISGRLLTKLQLVMVCSASFVAVTHITYPWRNDQNLIEPVTRDR